MVSLPGRYYNYHDSVRVSVLLLISFFNEYDKNDDDVVVAADDDDFKANDDDHDLATALKECFWCIQVD